jgi:hypothetical protein
MKLAKSATTANNTDVPMNANESESAYAEEETGQSSRHE